MDQNGARRETVRINELLTTTERENKRLHDEWFETAISYKIEWEKEIERCRAMGVEPLRLASVRLNLLRFAVEGNEVAGLL